MSYVIVNRLNEPFQAEDMSALEKLKCLELAYAPPLRNLGMISQPIGTKWQDARPAFCDQSGWKVTAMTEIDRTLDPFVEAEIKEHHAALMRQFIAVAIVICLLLILVGLHQ
jgi:hypothetical protein